MRGGWFRTFLMIVLLGAQGCGTTTELETDGPTPEEAPMLVQALLFATLDATSVLPPRPAATSGAWAVDFEADVRCPRGGRVGLVASLAVWESEGRAEYRLLQIPRQCAAGEGSREIHVSGAPRMAADVVVSHGPEGRVDWRGEAVGEVMWVSEGRTGPCAFDVSFIGSETPDGARSADVVGVVCGLSVDQTVFFQ